MPFSTRTMRAADWKNVKHFAPGEFVAPGKMGYEMVLWLDKVRAKAQVPMTVSSGYRTAEYNKAVGGAKDSAHTDVPCDAVDIRAKPTKADPHWNYARARIIGAALELGCVRVGLYPNGSIHLDRTEDRRPAPRIWIAVDNKA